MKLLLFLTSCSLALHLARGSAYFTVYEDHDHECCDWGCGTCETFYLPDNTCMYFTFYDEKITSINTHGNCIQIWEHRGCKGASLIMGPGTPHHDNLSWLHMKPGYNWDNEISSISNCPEPTTTTIRPTCSSNQFQCRNGKCIRASYVCDNDMDCDENEDKFNCPTTTTTTSTTTTTTPRPTCSSTQFQCQNGKCIKASYVCDNDRDCDENEDEFNCPTTTTSTTTSTTTTTKAPMTTTRAIERTTLRSPSQNDIPMKIKNIDINSFNVTDFSIHVTDLELYYIAFKKTQPNQGLDGRTVLYGGFSKIVIYIHGFATTDLNDGVLMKNALLNEADDVDCVIIFDWRKYAYYDNGGWDFWPPNKIESYTHVVTQNVNGVSMELKKFMKTFIPDNVHIHLIGFSLGGQVSGIAARSFQDTRLIDRISALDPAGPIYEYTLGVFPLDTTNTLRNTDAKFVDVIHASTVLGMVKEAGHLDIYIDEIDCTFPSCLHYKAVETFITSITLCSQITCPQEKDQLAHVGGGIFMYICRTSSPEDLSSLGYLADLYEGRGKHVIHFYYNQDSMDDGPPTVSTETCSPNLNNFLPAKHRVCRKPPNDAGECRSKPYLAICRTTCGQTLIENVCTSNGMRLTNIEEQRLNTSNTNIELQRLINTTQITNNREGLHDSVKWTGPSCKLPLSCRGEDGSPVDFFITLKLPNSLDYIYYTRSTSQNPSSEWTLGTVPISSPKSILSKTLSPIYDQIDPVSYITWNDDLPRNEYAMYQNNNNMSENDSVGILTSTYGHSKGVLALNEGGSLLLTHSIPRFPPSPDLNSQFKFPKSGQKFTQMAICISSPVVNNLEQIDQLMDSLIAFKPQVYASNILITLPQQIRDKFSRLVNPPRSPRLGAPVFSYKKFGPDYFHIVSAGRSREDLAEDSWAQVANAFKTSIIVQTWKDRVSPWPSKCDSQFKIENVEASKVSGVPGLGIINWSRSSDHSKWAVSKNPAIPLVCVGDLNRAQTTMARGGMSVCLQDIYVHRLFSSLPAQVEACI